LRKRRGEGRKRKREREIPSAFGTCDEWHDHKREWKKSSTHVKVTVDADGRVGLGLLLGLLGRLSPGRHLRAGQHPPRRASSGRQARRSSGLSLSLRLLLLLGLGLSLSSLLDEPALLGGRKSVLLRRSGGSSSRTGSDLMLLLLLHDLLSLGVLERLGELLGLLGEVVLLPEPVNKDAGAELGVLERSVEVARAEEGLAEGVVGVGGLDGIGTEDMVGVGDEGSENVAGGFELAGHGKEVADVGLKSERRR
jgi:hypothetical protein